MRRLALQVEMGVALGMGAVAPVQAQSSVESFDKGKTINMVVGYTSGGGFDIDETIFAGRLT
jgi:tripartite-type tricarboxylate transporter receptor subunit TctC